MSHAFGRRTPPPYGAPPSPASEPPPIRSAWTPLPDPELEAWKQARTKARWTNWAMAGLLVLGGPLSFLLPQPFGMLGGLGLTVALATGFVARRRGTKADTN